MIVRYRYLEKNNFLINRNFLALKKFLISGQYISDQIRINFEKKIAKYLKGKYCLGVSSGTNAIYLALKAAKINKNHEILVPAISWLSTYTAAKMTGAKVIGVDIDENLHMCLDSLKRKISKKTKAIIFVHFAGLVSDLSVLSKFCKKNKIILIEDCAQSFGAKINNIYSGTFGNFGAFSMNPMKVYSSIGEAGLILFKNKKYKRIIEILRYAGAHNKEKSIVAELNHKIDNLHCFILSNKLGDLSKIIKKRIQIAKYYDCYLTNKIKKPLLKTDFSHTYYSYIIKTNRRNSLIKFLKRNKIEFKIQHRFIISDQTPFKEDNKNLSFKSANIIKNQILSLPIDESLNKNQIKFVVNTINKFYEKY